MTKLYKILFCYFVVLPNFSFNAQPPLPPKPPALLKAAAVVERIILPSPWEPVPPMRAYFESKSKKGTKTVYTGIVKINAQGGMLTCSITYDSQNNSYCGQIINNRFSTADWGSQELDPGKAKEYYDNLREQDEDQKKRLA